MNKLELTNAIAKKLNVSYKFANTFLDSMLVSITEELVNGGKVKLVDFGVFEVAKRAPRKGHNPRTGEVFPIPACNEPVFKPGKELKQIIKEA